MNAFIALLDHRNCPVDGSPFPLLQDTSGNPILPATGDFFRKGLWNYKVDGIYWDYDEQSVTVVASEIYGQRPLERPL